MVRRGGMRKKGGVIKRWLSKGRASRRRLDRQFYSDPDIPDQFKHPEWPQTWKKGAERNWRKA